MAGIEELVGALRRGWWLVLACTAIAATSVYSLSVNRSAVYQSTGRYVLGPANLTDARDLVDSSAALERRSIVTTFAEILTGVKIVDAAKRDATLPRADSADFSVRSSVLPAANVVELRVQGPDPGAAQLIASKVAARASKYFEELYSVYGVDVLDDPDLPAHPVAPRPSRDATLAGFGGAMTGLLIAIGLSSWRQRGQRERWSSVIALDEDVRELAAGSANGHRVNRANGAAAPATRDRSGELT